MNILNSGKTRIQIVDALRGFSLAGIVIVHLVENYIGAPTPEGALEATHIGIPDYVVDGIIGIFFRGKFFALFSFLFGLSFFIQMDRARDKGQDYRWRFLWRLLLLLGIGIVHHMFYRGDILTIYALLGVFLIPFYKLRNPWVLTVAALLFLGLGRFLIFLYTHGDNLFLQGGFDSNSPEVVAYFELLKTGTINEVMHSNATEGQLMKMDFQFGIFSRGYLTLGFFLLGLYAGRIRFFENFEEKWGFMQNILYGSIGLFAVGIGITILGFAPLGPVVTFDNWNAMIGLTGMDLVNVALTFMLITLFVYLYKKVRWRQWLQSFAPYGRMALTNYVFQSILGAFIFYGWGLGYVAKIPNRYTFLLAFGVIALQMVISRWWLNHFYYGPLEWVWRSLTHFKYYPLRRKS
ncbi:DUF418 domain-containing protein [Flavobacteriaceae bacterium D16]|nr:DUF418 domain-containing protein [Flavobacteriaceae bacterium D16]